MPALPEYRTRILLEREGVPLVTGVFVPRGGDVPEELPDFPLYLKSQIPGATSRKSKGLVRCVENPSDTGREMQQLMETSDWGETEGVLITAGLDIEKEFYAGCTLDLGSRKDLPGGLLLFSTAGGSGVEGRSGSLLRMPFSLLDPPSEDEIAGELSSLEDLEDAEGMAAILRSVINTFIGYKLIVLEINPLAVLADGSIVAVDTRAEFEKTAVRKGDSDIFSPPGAEASADLTRLEKVVELINRDDPSGTGFFRQNRSAAPEGSTRVATNLCGGGGKMLWEMTTGSRTDIHTMNESDTSGGLSAFKSYRILRVILAQEGAQALLLTGSGMAFQNQHHLAAAVWKALRESPTPLPSLLRFGGTDEDKAGDLFRRVSDSLPVPVRTYPPEVFPNAMVDHVSEIASEGTGDHAPPPRPEGEPAILVETPPGKIFFFSDRWCSEEAPPSVKACPTGFLRYAGGELSADPEARCIGCLMCETASILEGNGELFVQLDMPEEVD